MVRTREISHDSADVVLEYSGDGRSYVRDAPARDLTGSDIARVAYLRELAEVAQDVGQPIDREDPDKGVVQRPDPRAPKAETIRTVLDELEASGKYAAPSGRVPRGTTESKPAEQPAEATPEQPAEEPEG